MSKIYCIVLFVCTFAMMSCSKDDVSEQAVHNASNVQGTYIVTGTMDRYPYKEGEKHAYIPFSGRAILSDKGDANVAISYTSDKTGATYSILSEIDDNGNFILNDFSLTVDGISCSAHTLSSSISRKDNDTISGTVNTMLTVFVVLQRRCDLQLTAVRVSD